MHIGTALRRERLRQDIRQAVVADKAEVTRQYLCDIEHGRKMPRWDVACRLADVLGVGLEALRDPPASAPREP